SGITAGIHLCWKLWNITQSLSVDSTLTCTSPTR
ncbi:unnamed protein product, partial [Tetraodon nigroviridis]